MQTFYKPLTIFKIRDSRDDSNQRGNSRPDSEFFEGVQGGGGGLRFFLVFYHVNLAVS